MKQLLALIAVVITIVSLVVLGVTFQQIYQQQTSLTNDLQHRTALLADSLKEAIRPSYLNNATTTLQKVLDKFAGRERLLGLAVYDNKAILFANSIELQQDLINNITIPEKAWHAPQNSDTVFHIIRQ